MLSDFYAKKKLISVVVFIGAVLIAAGVLLFPEPFEARLASQSVNWTQQTGEGMSIPACNSASPPLIACSGGTPVVTVYWDACASEYGVNFGISSINSGGPWNIVNLEPTTCSGSYTFNALSNTIYWYYLEYFRGIHVTNTGYSWDIWSFTTPDCNVGTIKLQDTVDGVLKGGGGSIDNIRISYKFNYQPQPDYNGPIPNILSPIAAGEYKLKYESGGPPGVNFKDITPSDAQAVNAGETKTFTFNFVTPCSAPEDFHLNEPSATCNSVSLSWDRPNNADAYRILKGSARVDITPYQPYTALSFTDPDGSATSTVTQNTTYQYQIEAYNVCGTKRSNEKQITTPYCPPDLTFWVNPSQIYQGQTTSLNWNILNDVTSCNASSNPSQSDWNSSPIAIQLPSGNKTVIPSPPPWVTYYLECFGRGGTSGKKPASVDISPLGLPGWREIIPR